MSRYVTVAAAAFVALAAVACTDDPTTPAPRADARASRSLGAARAESIAVAPDSARVIVGRTTRLVAVVRDTAGAPVDRAIRWSSSDTTIARVDSAGVVTGVALGAATITAASDALSATARVTVHDASVYRVTIAPGALGVVAGDTLTLAAASLDAQDGALADRAIRWASRDTTVVAVDSLTGTVTARQAGTAYVIARDGAVVDSARVDVAPAVAAVRVLATLDSLETYETRPMLAVHLDSAGRVLTHGQAIARRAVRWSSSDTTIARVDSVSGLLTGVDRGTVTITATSTAKDDTTLTGTATRVVVIRYRSLVTATEHACDLASGGVAWCWGRNASDGRIGMERLGDTVTSNVPVRVPGGLRFTQLAAYGRATCGLTEDGKAYCWGYNGWGMLARPTNVYQSATPVLVSQTLRFRALAAGAEHVCGLAIDGHAHCWGANSDGQFGTGAKTSSTTPVGAAGGMTFAAITAGTGFTCGITPAGEAWCWGYSGLGNLGEGEKISFGNTYRATPQRVVGGHTFRTIHASNQYACALTPAGDAYCWGNNANGQLGAPSTTATSTPVPVAGGLTFRSIATGYGFACGVASDAAVHCWGLNKDGQLGASIGNGSTRPIRAAGSLVAAEVSTANVATGGGSYACAVTADRLSTVCWGRNDKGQLGNGTTANGQPVNPTPTIVVGQKPLPIEEKKK